MTIARWEDVPAERRVTEVHIQRLHPENAQALRRRLVAPGCHAAVKFLPDPSVLAPCSMRPRRGSDFCSHHSDDGIQPLPRLAEGPLVGLTMRAVHCLTRAGYETPAQIRAATDEELLSIRNLGAGSLAEVRQMFPYEPSQEEGRCAAMSDQTETFATWAILELFGHRRLAGYVTEQQIAGAGFIRLDVPDGDGVMATQFYSPSAVYALTPTTEEIARGFALNHQPQPVTAWELPSPKARSAVIDSDDPYAYEPDDDDEDDETDPDDLPFG